MGFSKFPFFLCVSALPFLWSCVILRPQHVHACMYSETALPSLADPVQVTALEQRCQKLESEVQKLAQTWSEAAPAEEIKVSPHAAHAEGKACWSCTYLTAKLFQS